MNQPNLPTIYECPKCSQAITVETFMFHPCFVPVNCEVISPEDKAALALESMEILFKHYLSNTNGIALNKPVKAIMENWREKTCKPFSHAEYIKMTERLISHLIKKEYKFIPDEVAYPPKE